MPVPVRIVNGMPFLESLVGKWVLVKIACGFEVKGRLVSFDTDANNQLTLVEVHDGDVTLNRSHRKFIPGVNVLDIQDVTSEFLQQD